MDSKQVAQGSHSIDYDFVVVGAHHDSHCKTDTNWFGCANAVRGYTFKPSLVKGLGGVGRGASLSKLTGEQKAHLLMAKLLSQHMQK